MKLEMCRAYVPVLIFQGILNFRKMRVLIISDWLLRKCDNLISIRIKFRTKSTESVGRYRDRYWSFGMLVGKLLVSRPIPNIPRGKPAAIQVYFQEYRDVFFT